MERRDFKCVFLSDIVLNAHTATEGKSMAMDYIPGSVFLGIVGKKYESFGEKAFEIFHSGQVRFSDAHPSLGSKRSWKIPYSWFDKKLDSAIKSNSIDAKKVFIYHKMKENQKEQIKTEDQLKQMRKGFFTDNGEICQAEHSFSMKSGYDLEKRRARDAQIYGYDALRKGTEWIFSIECDNPGILDNIAEKVCGNHRIGRSRSCQYGQVKIEKMDAVKDCKTTDTIMENQITLYAESCLAFVDQYGQPTWDIIPENLMLPQGAKIHWQSSQIRTKVFAPWNRSMKMRDKDRVCIDKGSVFVVQVPSNFDIKAFRQSIAKGVGLYRSEGMGKILVNPQFLETEKDAHPILENGKKTQTEKIVLCSLRESDGSDSGIFEWLKQQEEVNRKNNILMENIDAFIKENRQRYENITPSQWGSIREKAMGNIVYSKMIEALFQKETGFLMHGKSEKDWKEKERQKILQQAIEDIHKKLGDSYARIFVVKLCSEMAKHVSPKKGERK